MPNRACVHAAQPYTLGDSLLKNIHCHKLHALPCRHLHVTLLLQKQSFIVLLYGVYACLYTFIIYNSIHAAEVRASQLAQA